MLFASIFLLGGTGFFYKALSGEFSWNKDTFTLLLFGLVFAGVGGSLLYRYTEPVVFDKRKGCFWKGRKAPDEVFNTKALKTFAELDEIHALQLISEYCRRRGRHSSSYYSYGLNIVLEDGSRIYVVDHGDQSTIRAKAATLSDFLGKPVWDAI